MSKTFINIGLACGGTGGHISPALALVNDFKNYNLNPHFFTDIRGSNLIKPHSYYLISSGSPSEKGIKKIFNILKIVCGIFQSTYFLYRNKINIVIGFGGYTSVPIVVAAKLLKIPLVIHEQNSILGRANRFCSIFCDKIAMSFDLKLKKKETSKYVFTGNPVLSAFEKIGNKRFQPLHKKRITILVIGGSQGAKFFADIIPKTLKQIPEELKDRIFIYQQCRIEDKGEIVKKYKKINIKFNVEPFFNKIYEIFEESDLIISRSGASTITEIAAAGRPSILIPFPFSTDNHQKQNALVFEIKNASILLEEGKLEENLLSKKLCEILSNKNKLSKMAENAKLIHNKGASKNLINLAISTIDRRMQ